MRTLANERFRWSEAIRRSAVVAPRGRFLLRELTRRPGTAAYRLRDSGLAVHVRHDTGDIAGLQEIFLNGNYDPPPRVASALAAIAHDHPLRIVDLGANIGLFPLSVFARFAGVSVLSFEPDPDNARVLELTRRANARAGGWELVEACVGAAPRKVAFHAGLHMESHVAGAADPDAMQIEMVDVFDHLAGTDWLKMDIEGGEWEILCDPRFAALEIPVVALEYHPAGCPSADAGAKVLALLEDAGYTVQPYVERSPGLGELWALRC